MSRSIPMLDIVGVEGMDGLCIPDVHYRLSCCGHQVIIMLDDEAILPVVSASFFLPLGQVS